jgi:hypothetical protein
MKTRIFQCVATLAGCLLYCGPALAQQSLQTLHQHVPPAVSGGQATLVGSLPPVQQMKLTMVLPLRNQGELASLLHRLYDPSSPDYRHFLSVEQFTEQFGPTAEDYQAVAAFAKASGFTVDDAPANRLILSIRGSVAQIETAFHVRMNDYQHPVEDRTFFSPDREPSLDLTVPIAHIAGLNNFFVPHPIRTEATQQQASAGITGVTGSGPGGSYLGSDMRAAYYGNSILTGSGQSVGLFELYGYDPSDVDLTFSSAGQSYSVPINNVVLDGASQPYYGSDTEQVLDIVQAIGMAPGLSQVRVYIGSVDTDIFNAMATENLCKQISVSWTLGDPSTNESIFEEYAAQGQSLFIASGDGGANTGSGVAEDDYVTSVGATHLVTNGPGGAWRSETAWNGSAGGVSEGVPIPSWQIGIANAGNEASTTERNVPDVAMEGDYDNFACGNGGCIDYLSGTSFAAPRWAGFMALINQQAVANGAAPNGGLGFINPSIYAIGTGADYGSDFHDITTGNNITSILKGGYNAVPGYDLVTGWGSANGQNLIDALAGAPAANFGLSTSPGVLSINQGSSTATTVTVMGVGGFAGTADLSISGLPSGVTASWSANPTAGTSVLTLAAGSAAPPGTYTAIIGGASGALTASTTLVFTIQAPSFYLSASPGVLIVTPGSSYTSTITVNPAYGFTGSVNLSVAGLPSGVTATWGTNPATGTSLLTLAVSSSASPGTSMLSIAGSSGGISAGASVVVTVRNAAAGTATALSVTAGGAPVTSVASGSAVTLAATVSAGSTALTTGQVNFCDATAPHCTDIHLLGTAQLTSAGTAVLKFVPGPGSHSYKAIFVGTAQYAASTSTPLALAVTSSIASATTIAQSGAPGDYTLTATVMGQGAVPPTGTISFLDSSNANAVLGTATLAGEEAALAWLNSQSPSAIDAMSVAVGDFNGDGIPDLAVADLIDGGTNGGVTILLGNGDGTFKSAGVIQTNGPDSWSVAVGDFNSDGKADLAVANASSNNVTILLGNGDGTFTAQPVSPPTGDFPQFVTVADLNGDGIPDLAVANGNDVVVTILLGNGDGTFTAAPSVNTDSGPVSIAVADFNGDGIPDLAVANADGYSVTLYLGNGNGTFTASSSAAVERPVSVAVADFNGDGIPDLAVANEHLNTVTVLLGNGDGTFSQAPVSPAAGHAPVAVAVGDFNDDGKADLAVANSNDNTVSILLGNGDGTFTAGASPSTGSNPGPVAAGSFKSDGQTGLAVVNESSETVTVLTTQLTQTAIATASGISPAGTGTHQVVASYPGDSIYTPSVSAATGLTATSASSFSVSGTSVTISIPGATTANTSTVTVTPAGGFTGTVALSAVVTTSPAGAQDPPTLSFGSTSPISINGASPGIATLTITTTAPTSAALVHPKSMGEPWSAAGGATLACVLLFGIPVRRRRWRAMLGILCLLAFLTGGLASCGGGGSSSGSGSGNPGTTAGTYTVTVTGTSGSTTETTAVTLIVN